MSFAFLTDYWLSIINLSGENWHLRLRFHPHQRTYQSALGPHQYGLLSLHGSGLCPLPIEDTIQKGKAFMTKFWKAVYTPYTSSYLFSFTRSTCTSPIWLNELCHHLNNFYHGMNCSSSSKVLHWLIYLSLNENGILK